MCRKSIYLVCICMLGLTPLASANLVGWWKLDEGTGTVVQDSSGNGLDGAFVGSPQWASGFRDGALQFDGSSWVDVGFSRKTARAGTLSLACWIYPDKLGPVAKQDRAIAGRDGGYAFKATGNKLRLTTPGLTDHDPANAILRTGTWQHVAVTFQAGPDGLAIFYVDGVETDRVAVPKTLAAGDGPFRIANNQYSNQMFFGMIDDVRLYDHILSPDEVKQLALRTQAYDPTPADMASGISTALLQWKAGGTAMVHNVYLGTSPELTAADQIGANLTTPMQFGGILQPGTTYFWCVDEVEPDMVTVHRSDIWSFTTTPKQASAPQPVSGARYVEPQATLGWLPGAGGMMSDVYFGTDRAAVEAGAEGTLKVSQPLPSYTPEGLEQGKTYYWRVDSVAGADKVAGEVWSFTVLPTIAKSDPNLVGWWKLDDENSATAVDSSGWDNYGKLEGPTWADGYLGDALAFDGVDDGVDCGTDASVNTVSSVTVAAWVKLSSLGVDRKIASNQNNSTGGYKLGFYTNNKVEFEIRTSANASTNNRSVTGGTVVEQDVWYHVAGVYSNGQFIRTYVNGKLDREQTTPNVLGVSTGPLRLGRESFSTANWWRGLLDDVRVYNEALTEEEVAKVMLGDPLVASDPQPGNGTDADIRSATELTWSAGATAATHIVYFGADKAAVKAADTDSPECQGQQAGTSFASDSLVAFGGGSYFWRVDEVEADGATLHRGNVWGFTVPACLIVDEFETYNDLENQGTRIYDTWIDGLATQTSGSTVGNWNPPFAERVIVHGGKQSMPMDYNNLVTPFYSEAYREFAPVEDWTADGVTDLSLWFRGNPRKMVETAPGSYTITSRSGDISGTVDNFRFVCKQLVGDGSISAKILSVTRTAPWSKAGVMVREMLTASSAHAHMIITGSGRKAFENRPVGGVGSFSAYSPTGSITPPLWVKVERKGSEITGYYSTDGVDWVKHPDNENTAASRSPNPQLINMIDTIYIGLLVTSNNLAASCIAEFSDVVTTGTVAGEWQIVDIGVNAGNDPAQLYVAVEDGNGKRAVVNHPDAGAVNLTAAPLRVGTDWTEWKIPLSQFTGVNFTKVERMYIGVGDKSTTGTGRIYIDDITLTRP